MLPPEQSGEDPLIGNKVRKKRGRYKHKSVLDEFLFNTLGGKYKHKRIAIFREYLKCFHGYSEVQAESLIKSYPIKCPSGITTGFQNQFLGWVRARRAEIRREKALKGAAKRWKKAKTAVRHPKTALEHPKTALEHPKTAIKHKKK